mmetsp:Transcript_32271/g.51472  ORF Transcript_32271/g.51472 Transcript_32271/m.51472 type:complete len:518 (-) Transcript_32271:5400-6953(-)
MRVSLVFSALLVGVSLVHCEENVRPADECAASPEECAKLQEKNVKKDEPPVDKKKVAAKARSMGDELMMKKKYRDAIQFFTKAIKAEPTDERNYLKRYKAYSKFGNTKNALEDLNKIIEMKPDHISAFAFRGKTLLDVGRCPEAAQDFEKVLAIKPKHGDAKKLLPRAMECGKQIQACEKLMEQKQFELAEEKLSELIEVTGKAPYIKFLRAKARYHTAKYFEAIADLGDVLKKQPDNQEALLFRGMSYYRVADHEMAIRHFREGLSMDPEHKETKTFYKMLQKMLKLNKKGDTALKTHNHQALLDALGYFKAAIEVDPSHTEYVKTLYSKICKIYAKMKKVDEASKACEEAIRIDEGMLEPYITLAELKLKIAEETPDFEEAIRAWQRAHEVDGENQAVREGLHKAEVGLKQSKQKNYYKILGVPRDADNAIIKRKYRKLAKEFHPDRHTDKGEEEKAEMESKFQLIAEAYEVLSDDEMRGKYDRGEEVFENQGGQQRHHHHHGFGRRGQSFHFNF